MVAKEKANEADDDNEEAAETDNAAKHGRVNMAALSVLDYYYQERRFGGMRRNAGNRWTMRRVRAEYMLHWMELNGHSCRWDLLAP